MNGIKDAVHLVGQRSHVGQAERGRYAERGDLAGGPGDRRRADVGSADAVAAQGQPDGLRADAAAAIEDSKR